MFDYLAEHAAAPPRSEPVALEWTRKGVDYFEAHLPGRVQLDVIESHSGWKCRVWIQDEWDKDRCASPVERVRLRTEDEAKAAAPALLREWLDAVAAGLLPPSAPAPRECPGCGEVGDRCLCKPQGNAPREAAPAKVESMRAALVGYMREHDRRKQEAMGPEYSTVECDCDLCCAADDVAPTMGPPDYAPAVRAVSDKAALASPAPAPADQAEDRAEESGSKP